MIPRALSSLLLCGLLVISGLVAAQAIDPLPFKDHAQELRFQHLIGQLRCLVCQNENLADSDADLARDLRHQVFNLMQTGNTDAQIKQYLVDRYSDFVLYDPPLQPNTLLLWFGPLAILLAGAAAVVITVRRRNRITPDAPNDAPSVSATGPSTTGDDW